jgi:hypothetical protein
MRLPVCRIFGAILVVLTLGACVAATHPRGSGIVVHETGRVLARLTLPQLQHLPQAQIATPHSQGAQVQKGPTVHSVLDAAGATAVNNVRVEGRDPAQTMSAAELADQVILAITKQDTLKLAGARLGVDRWVRDVTALVVNP